MAKIKIAELDINTDALLKATSELKKEIDFLKKQQKDLQKAGQGSSKQFVQNASDLKTLNKAYNDNIKALSANTQAIADQANRTELLTLALNTEVNSIKEAREQNKLLNKLRNEANLATKEGQEELKNLNDKLDKNNEFIKENADAYTQQKINIGNYKDSIKEALGELNLLNGGIGGFIQRSQEAGGVGNLLQSSLGGAAKGFLGLTRASLAFIATPVGAVVAALVAAFALVKNALNRSEESTAKLSKAFSGITGIFKGVLKALEPIGEFLIDVLVNNIELAEKAFFAAANGISKALAFLGFDEAAESVSSFVKGLEDTAKANKELEVAQNNYTKAQRESRKVQLDFQKDAEKLRQIRDDETKSFQERIKANEELGATLQKQLADELALAQTALEVANLRLKVEGETTEALDARAEALTEIADIQERITGQESEQLVNRVQLQREAADRAIENQKAELDLFIESQGIRAKTLQEEANIAQQVADKKLNILRAELNNRKITQAQFDAEEAKIKNELLQAQTDAAVANADRELQEFIRKNQSKIDNEKFFSEELLLEEENRLNSIAEKQKLFEKERLKNGVINQQEYNDAINAINDENEAKIKEKRDLRDEAEKQKKAIDLENQRILDEQNFTNEFDLESQRLELQKQQEIENAEATGADVKLINEKFANFQDELEKKKNSSIRQQNAQTFGELAQLFGEASKIGKAFSLAQATITGYESVLNAYSTAQKSPITLVNPAYPVIRAGLAGAFSAVQIAKIAGAKFEKGGLQEIGGKRHVAGGTKFVGEDGTAFEAEQGELIGVMNRNAAQHFMAFNNAFPSGKSTPSFFQGGGIVSQAVNTQALNTNELAEITAEAVASVPAPIVTVEDINAGQVRTVEVESGADL